jgi:hypothetical protein
VIRRDVDRVRDEFVANQPGQPDPPTGWRVTEVVADESDIVIHGMGDGFDATVRLALLEGDAPELTVSSRLTARRPIRRWRSGVRLALAPSLDTLFWLRKTAVSSYPKHHIGRPHGVARALPPHTPDPALFALTATGEGTADFRSTRFDITRAELTDQSSAAVVILERGSPIHTRCAQAGDVVSLQVLDHVNVGSEPFLKSFLPADADLCAGDTTAFNFALQLISPR